MILVADEIVDFGIITILREKGITIICIAENFSGIKDTEVLKIANENNCLLITEDKDFGELTHRLKIEHCGILLIRLSDLVRQERILVASETIINYFDKLKNNFSVLNKSGLRIKTTQS